MTNAASKLSPAMEAALAHMRRTRAEYGEADDHVIPRRTFTALVRRGLVRRVDVREIRNLSRSSVHANRFDTDYRVELAGLDY